MIAEHLKLILIGIPCALAIFASGCYSGGKTVNELSERQDALEARMDELSQEIEIVTSKIERNVERIESNQLKLAEEIQNMRQKNVKLVKKIDKVTGNKKSVKANPPDKPSKISADVIYSKAVSSYNEGKFEDAILEYQKLIDSYPRDRRVPEAYLKQGLALINLGRNKEARFFLNTLIDKYPDSREAQTARAKLKTI